MTSCSSWSATLLHNVLKHTVVLRFRSSFDPRLNTDFPSSVSPSYTSSISRIYEDIYKDLTLRNQSLARDPSSTRALDVPLYLLNLERDALLYSIDMHWEYR